MYNKHGLTALIALVLSFALFLPVFAESDPGVTGLAAGTAETNTEAPADQEIVAGEDSDAAVTNTEETEEAAASESDLMSAEVPDTDNEPAEAENDCEVTDADEQTAGEDEVKEIKKLKNGIEIDGVKYIVKGKGELFVDDDGTLCQSEPLNYELRYVTADESINGYKEGNLLSEDEVQSLPFPEGTTVTFTYQWLEEDFEVVHEQPSYEAAFDGAALADNTD